jgi:predicted DNA-binding transcriptional regulator AlpA
MTTLTGVGRLAQAARIAVENAGGIVGRPQLEKLWGVSRARIEQLTNDPTFPAPLPGMVGQSKAWLKHECDVWRQDRMQ